MAAKFVVKKGTTGKFRFNLLGTIATSEAYNTKAACLNGIKAVKAAAAAPTSKTRPPRRGPTDRAKLKAATATAAKAAKKAIKQAAGTARPRAVGG